MQDTMTEQQAKKIIEQLIFIANNLAAIQKELQGIKYNTQA